jgi:Bacteriophage lambda head decoration protein D
MSVIATESRRFSNLVKKELWPESAYCRAVVTVNETTAKNYVVGTALGKVTVGGKYKIAVQTASDGSQVVDALVLGEYAVAANTDTKVLVLIKGPAEVSKFGIVLDATYDLDAEKNAVYAALEAKGINVLDAV